MRIRSLHNRLVLSFSMCLVAGVLSLSTFGQGCGTVWTAIQPKTPPGDDLTAVSYLNGRFVALGWSGAWLMESTDGLSWDPVQDFPYVGDVLDAVAYGNHRYVVAASDCTVYVSKDGLSWKKHRVRRTGGWLVGIAFGRRRFVAAGDSGWIYTSRNGTAWTKRHSGVHKGLRSVAFDGKRFVAVGYGGVILKSRDGKVWHRRKSGIESDLTSVTYGPQGFIAVGAGVILTSPKGKTWTQVAGYEIASSYLDAVTWTGNQYVAVGEQGVILTSPDGTQWTARDSGTSEYLYGVGSGDGQIIAVGSGGTMLRSVCGGN